MGSLIGNARREAFARRVRIEMAKLGLTREVLAARAEVKERTLGNLLAAQPVRDLTVAKVARVLGIDLDEILTVGSSGEAPASDVARAGEIYGGYMLAAYEGYLGTYIAYRRVFADRNELFRSVYDIDWDEALCRLRFLELQRFRGAGSRPVSSSHGGGIFISPHTGLLQLLTTFQGALRLVTLTRFRMGDTRLRGLMLTQSDRDRFFEPAVSSLYLERLEGKRPLAELERLVGPIGPDDPEFAAAETELAAIDRAGIFTRRDP